MRASESWPAIVRHGVFSDNFGLYVVAAVVRFPQIMSYMFMSSVALARKAFYSVSLPTLQSGAWTSRPPVYAQCSRKTCAAESHFSRRWMENLWPIHVCSPKTQANLRDSTSCGQGKHRFGTSSLFFNAGWVGFGHEVPRFGSRTSQTSAGGGEEED